jgi:uncharacterized membrane protein
MLISTRAPAPRSVVGKTGQSRIGSAACAGLALLILLAALLLFGATFFLSYKTLQTQLVALYGSNRTSRYFSPEIYSSALLRLRVAAGCLVLAASAIAGFRGPLARAFDSLVGSILMSVRHARRSQWSVDPVRAVALSAIAIIGLFLRFQFLEQPMRYDESATVLSYASKPLYLGLSIYNEPNNHLFHTLLVHLAMKVAGSAEWAVRLPAFTFGTLLCLFAYALCRRLAGSSSALWAAALVCTSSVLVEYSTNARGYTLICCATLAMMIAAYETLRHASPMWFVLFGTITVLGFWTIPIFLIPFGGTALWMIWESMCRRRRFRRIYALRGGLAVVLAGAITVAMYLPPLAINGIGALLRNQWVAPRNLRAFLAGNETQLSLTWQAWNRDLPTWWPMMMMVAFLGGLAIAPKLRRLVICLLSCILFLFAVRHFVPFARNWLMFLPVYLMVAAVPFGWIVERLTDTKGRRLFGAVSAATLAALLSVPVLHQRSILQSKDTGVLVSAREVADFMFSRSITPDQVFRSSTSDLPMQYYWWRRTGIQPDKASVPELEARGVHHAWVLLNEAYAEELDNLAARQGLKNVETLAEEPFDGARMVEVTWQH